MENAFVRDNNMTNSVHFARTLSDRGHCTPRTVPCTEKYGDMAVRVWMLCDGAIVCYLYPKSEQ